MWEDVVDGRLPQTTRQAVLTATPRAGIPGAFDARWMQWQCVTRLHKWHEAEALAATLVRNVAHRQTADTIAPEVGRPQI